MAKKADLDKIREHFQKTGGGSSDNRFWNIKPPARGEKENKAIIRVLPWVKGVTKDGFWYYTAALHYGFRVGGRDRAIPCPESVDDSHKGKCAICLFISRLRDSGKYDKITQRIRQNRRYWVNMIDRENEDDGVKVFGSNKKFIEAVLDAGDDPDVGDITDSDNGRDIIIVRRGFGFNTRYSYRIRTKESAIEYDASQLVALDKDVVEWLTYEQVAQMIKDNYPDELRKIGLKFKLKEAEVEEEDEEEEEEEVVKKKVKKLKRGNPRKKKVEDEEEEEIEEEDADDDDSEEDEDVEEDEDDEEDDEE